jgi:hypothetical protein
MVNNILLPGERSSLVHDVQVGAREAGDHGGARSDSDRLLQDSRTPIQSIRDPGPDHRRTDISEQSSEMAAGRLADDGMMARVEACPTACLGDGMNMATGSGKLGQKNCCMPAQNPSLA